MTPERFQRIKEVFWTVEARPARERTAALAEICGDDEELRREVEALLAQHGASTFFATPAAARVATDLVGAPQSWLGRAFGPYTITGVLGVGGMGEVYRARDSHLRRDVAIKVLPAVSLSDPDRRARLDREARVLAALNHPNIAAIYGFEQGPAPAGPGEEPVHALVLELVEGPTLADRIAVGPVPFDEALPIARQIADALEAAHERGIVHRDLKPSNIKVTSDGTAKVLDFGLAKVEASQPAGTASSQSPTMTASMPGVLIGTAAYMSPEQVKAQETDRRSDVWAFGCVLYEMLSGRPAFEGDTITEVLASVLKTDPDWTRLPRATPSAVRRVLRRCLQKNRRERLHDMGDVRLDLNEADGESRSEHGISDASRSRERLAWGAVLGLVALAAAGLAWLTTRQAMAPRELRLDVATPPSADPLSVAISPDGRSVVFVAGEQGKSQLWLRAFDQSAARPLPGTEGGVQPFWAPDGRSLGFFAEGQLKRIDIDGNTLRTLAPVLPFRGGTWGADDTILLARLGGPLSRVPATGGNPVPVSELGVPAQLAHRWPQFLPDGRHFLYFVQGTAETQGFYLGDLAGSTARRWFEAEGAAVAASSGRILFVRQGTLFAQEFDPDSFALVGEASVITDGVLVGVGVSGAGRAAFSVSLTGSIAYRSAPARSAAGQFIWFDRTGTAVATVSEIDESYPRVPSFSPDRRNVVLDRTVSGNRDIWLLDLIRGVLSRLTSHPATDFFPIWSPDGSRVVFASNRGRGLALYEKRVDGSGEETLLLERPENIVPTDWSRDGTTILYRSLTPNTTMDVWALPLDGDRKPVPILQSSFDERDAVFSPDGKWIAYISDESGRFEIYVQPFRGPGPRQRVSTDGGTQPVWGPDGRELFYIAADSRLVSVPIEIGLDEAVEVGRPTPLFATRLGGEPASSTHEYLVSRDGQRFLMNTVVGSVPTSPISVILNWKPKL